MSTGLILLIAAGAIALLGWGCKASAQLACKDSDFTIGCLGALLFWSLEGVAVAVGVVGIIWAVVEYFRWV